VTGEEESRKEKEEERIKTEEQTKNKSSTLSLRFGLQYHTYWGQNLLLVGSSPTLGNWNVSGGHIMRWLPGNYWELDVEFPELSVFEYKYVVVLLDGDRFVDVQRWEERNNRYFDLTSFESKELTKLKTQLWNY